jgi:hypothetical protein
MEINVSNTHDIKSIRAKTFGRKDSEGTPIEGSNFADLILDLGNGNSIVISFDPSHLEESMSAWRDQLETVTQWLC